MSNYIGKAPEGLRKISADFFKEFVDDLGMCLLDVDAALDVAEGTVGKWTRGVCFPSARLLAKLVRTFPYSFNAAKYIQKLADFEG